MQDGADAPETHMVQLMTADEARQCADQIRRGMANVRHLLLDFYEREGWVSLGYESWRECAMAEFGYEQTHVYRLLDAAKVERNISPMGEKLVPERHLRSLAAVEPSAQREVWQRVIDTAPEGKVTVKHVEHTVTEWKYNQGIEYGAAGSTHHEPERDTDSETPSTVTLRVARVVYLMTMGRHMTIAEIASKTGLSTNGAWRLMERLAGGHHVPVVPVDGEWVILTGKTPEID